MSQRTLGEVGLQTNPKNVLKDWLRRSFSVAIAPSSVYMSGAWGSGKTAFITSLLDDLEIKYMIASPTHVYCSISVQDESRADNAVSTSNRCCSETATCQPRLFYEMLARQFSRQFPNSGKSDNARRRCSSVDDLVDLMSAVDDEEEVHCKTRVIIVQRADLLTGPNIGVLAELIQLPGMLTDKRIQDKSQSGGVCHWSVVLLSSIPLQHLCLNDYKLSRVSRKPLLLYMPSPTKTELIKSLQSDYRIDARFPKDIQLEFVKLVIDIHFPLTRSELEHRLMVQMHRPKMIQILERDLGVNIADGCVNYVGVEVGRSQKENQASGDATCNRVISARRLYSLMENDFQRGLSQLTSRTMKMVSIPETPQQPALRSSVQFNDQLMVSLVELPYLMKFLVIAGFLASKNSTEDDRRYYGSGRYAKSKRRFKRHVTLKKSTRLNTRSRLFTFNRLMAIFAALPAENIGLDRIYVCSALASICHLGLFRSLSSAANGQSRPYRFVGGDTRFRCLISDNLVKQLAKSVNLDLTHYQVFAED